MKRFALFFVACTLAFGLTSAPAAQAATTSTGVIYNSSGATRRCVCSVRCVSTICVVQTAAAPGFCAVPAGTMLNGDVAQCNGTVGVGGTCSCAVSASNKKI